MTEAHTYDEWKALGFQVRKGAKSNGRKDTEFRGNVATFTKDLVDPIMEYDCDHDEDFMDEWEFKR